MEIKEKNHLFAPDSAVITVLETISGSKFERNWISRDINVNCYYSLENYVLGLCICNDLLIPLPNEIKSLSKLRQLVIHNKKCAELPEWVANLQNLTYLDLGYCSFKSLPDWFISLKNLQVLILDDNNLIEIPTILQDLPNLQFLCLRKNKITTVSNSIGNFPSLSYIELHDNPLNYVSPEVANFPIAAYDLKIFLDTIDKALQKFIASNFAYNFLPLIEFMGINNLNLQLNCHLPAVNAFSYEEIRDDNPLAPHEEYSFQIEHDQGIIFEEGHIKYIRLKRSGLNSFPLQLLYFSFLTYIDLAENHITEIPNEIENLKDLKILILNKNALTKIPQSLGNLKNLKILDLSDNSIMEFPHALLSSSLIKLHLNRNAFQDFPNISTMEISYDLKIDPQWVDKFQMSLTLPRIGVQLFKPDFTFLVTLEEQIGEDIIQKDNPENNVNCTYYSEVDGHITFMSICSFGNERAIVKIPDIITQLTHLESLYLRYNKISEIPSSIGNVKTLRRLGFFANPIKQLPDTIGDLENLVELDISATKIMDLPMSIVKLNSLERLILNKLFPTPKNTILKKWFKMMKKKNSIILC